QAVPARRRRPHRATGGSKGTEPRRLRRVRAVLRTRSALQGRHPRAPRLLQHHLPAPDLAGPVLLLAAHHHDPCTVGRSDGPAVATDPHAALGRIRGRAARTRGGLSRAPLPHPVGLQLIPASGRARVHNRAAAPTSRGRGGSASATPNSRRRTSTTSASSSSRASRPFSPVI